ncbi:MAG: response regulator [Kofleriaceae bacterium]|nr:response regulator [Kofleriaceae bacterium]
MHRQADRYPMDLTVELAFQGTRRRLAIADLSRTGMFVRGINLSPGAEVEIAISPDGKRIATTARVTHQLGATEAYALGRPAGVGLAFCEPKRISDRLFAVTVERLIREFREQAPANAVHILVADADPRLLARMSTELGASGFMVTTANSGVEALAACFRRAPDVILLDRALPVIDGHRVLATLEVDPQFARIPVIMTSADLGDLAPAFDRGALDFIAKPFTATEVVARARRLATLASAPERVLLRGTLEGLNLGTLLTMFEMDRKTGRLMITSSDVGWIDIAEGRIVGAGTIAGLDPQAALNAMLGWTEGTFELSSLAEDGGLDLGITHVLLAHACAADEAQRDAA